MIKVYEEYIDKLNKDEYESILKNYRFKIGDIVRFNYDSDPNRTIFEIIGINTNDHNQPYTIVPINDPYKNRYWCSDFKLELVPEIELDTKKYNL